jgi:hypothetical protein
MTFAFGLFSTKAPRVELRPINYLSTDLRDHHGRARWDRLIRRWNRG